MGLRILYGTSQGALVEACVAEIDGAGGRWPDRRAMLLVPEQTKAEAERLYLERTGRTGILMAEILSFSRLAYRIQGETGGLSRSCVDTVGKTILLHALLKEHRPLLRALGVGAGRPGFVPQVGHVLGDLRRHGIEAGPLRQAAEAARGEDRAFAGKAEDLAFLMEQYAARMRTLGLYDREDDLWRLADVLTELREAMDQLATAGSGLPWPISRAAFLRSTSVWIAGFGQTREFTPQEYAVLAGLVGVCAQVTVTVCADAAPGDEVAVESGPDAFRIGRLTACRLAARFPGTTARPVPVALTPPFDRIGRELLGTAQADAPHTPVADPSVADPSVITTLFRSQEDEIRWTAGEIRRLTLTRGYRYGDIAIGVGNPSSYLTPLRAVFREFGLSPFIDEPRPLVGTSLYRFLRGLLDLKVHDWSLPAVTACLRSDFCRITRDEADRLENFLLARGLTGAGRVFDNRRYRTEFQSLTVMPSEDEESEEEPEEIRIGRDDRRAAEAAAAHEARALRIRVLEPLRDFLDTLGKEPSCAGKCRLLAGFLETYGVREAVGKRSDGLHTAGEDEAAITLVRAWNGIARVLDQMMTIAGDGRYDMEQFRDALAAGMEGAQSGAIPPVIDRLTVSGFERAGFRRARVLFLLGANEDSFPGSVPPEGLLKDPDRERISAQLGVRLPSVLRDQVFSDAALAYALLTSPSDALYLSAPVGSRPASGYIDLLRRVVPEGRHLTVGQADADDPRTGAVRPARRFLLASAADGTLPGDPGRIAVLRALADTLGFPAQESQGGRWRSWLEEDRVTARLPAALVRQTVGEQARMSVSQLERFAACPYAYFSQYLLRLQDRDIWSPQATDTGSLLHGILELAVRSLAEELAAAVTDEERQAVLARWQGLDYDRFADRCMREIAERDGYGLFFDAGIHASGGRRVQRLGSASLRAAVAQLSTDDAVPLCTEWRFGSGGVEALALHVQGVTVGFRGVIDRVDAIDTINDPVIDRVDSINPAGTSDFRIVDYKSGDVRFDPDKVFYGLSLQLPAYAAAYRNAHPGTRPVEMAYFRFQTPVATYAAHEGCRDEADARDRIARQFKLQKTGLDPAEIAEVTGHTLGRMDALCGALLSGKADARPARIGSSQPACQYCDCRAICGHEGKAFFHMKPLAELVPKEVEKNRMRKMIRAIRQTAPEEE